MNEEEIKQALKDHAQVAFDEIKDELGDKWDSLKDEHKDSAKRAATRLVKLEWQQRVNGDNVDGDIEFVKATVNGFRLAGEIALYDAFWKGVNKALEALGSFLVGAGKSLIPGLGALFSGIDIAGIVADE